jgi:hypothetical protein
MFKATPPNPTVFLYEWDSTGVKEGFMVNDIIFGMSVE